MSKLKLLIDGDALLYQLTFTAEHAVNWADIGQPELWTVWASEDETVFRLNKAITVLMETHSASSYCLFLSPPKNFRNDLFLPYKANRSSVRKPLILPRMRDIVLNSGKFISVMYPNIEADDAIGIAATTPSAVSGELPVLIISDDKDFNTIPARRVTFAGTGRDVIETDTQAADYYHMLQTLTGDTTDNYPGCPGIGPVKADSLLEKHKDAVWSGIIQAYEKVGLTEADALVQARCARILRYGEYEEVGNNVLLWTPDTQKETSTNE